MTVVTDTFDRADSATSLGSTDTGEAWTALSGTWGIDANRAYCVSALDNQIAVFDIGGTDHAISVSSSFTVNTEHFGLVARCVDANNHYLASMDMAGNTALYKRVGGAQTLLASASATGTAPRRMTLRCVGNSITVAVNGLRRINVLDSSLTTGTKMGLRNGANSNPGAGGLRWENLYAHTPFSFGMHLVSSTTVDLYKDGVFVERLNHVAQSGTLMQVAVHGSNTNDNIPLPHIGRVEVRDAPGGTLLYSDDFTSLTAWTTGWNPSTSWTIAPAGYAYNSGVGSLIYRTQPVGAAYFEAQDVFFDATVNTDGWLMLLLSRTSSGTAPTAPAGGTPDGYRMLFRPPGGPNPWGVELVDGTTLGGWSVGHIGF